MRDLLCTRDWMTTVVIGEGDGGERDLDGRRERVARKTTAGEATRRPKRAEANWDAPAAGRAAAARVRRRGRRVAMGGRRSREKMASRERRAKVEREQGWLLRLMCGCAQILVLHVRVDEATCSPTRRTTMTKITFIRSSSMPITYVHRLRSNESSCTPQVGSRDEWGKSTRVPCMSSPSAQRQVLAPLLRPQHVVTTNSHLLTLDFQSASQGMPLKAAPHPSTTKPASGHRNRLSDDTNPCLTPPIMMCPGRSGHLKR